VGRRTHRAAAAATAVAAGALVAATATAAASAPIVIRGPSAATYGSTYTVSGRTGTLNGRHRTGTVVLRGRWDDGTWFVLAHRRTDARGDYKLTIVLRRRGTLRLRLTLPGADTATKTLHVS
jgi:hypothetical protein